MPKRSSRKDRVTLWGGRFQKEMDPLFFSLSSSLKDDRRLFPVELEVNRAYAKSLFELGYLSAKESKKIEQGLRKLQKMPPPKEGYEDVHSYIEEKLTELCPESAQKLHLGRSRNDLVLTSLRLYVQKEVQTMSSEVRTLQRALVQQAETHTETLMPAFTHRQPAQPTTFAHFLLSYFFGFQRDRKRLQALQEPLSVLPLGSCSVVGTGIPLPQEKLASALGFATPVQNSLDMVGDRDFLLDLLHALFLIQLRLSRLSEDFLFWSHPYIGGIELPEAFCTGSSAMPHKKNPDALELIRSHASRLAGAYTQLGMLLKGLGSSYHRDLQEDKPVTFSAIQTVTQDLRVMARIVQQMKPKKRGLYRLLEEDLLALDVAEILSCQGVPFRKSHREVGQWVKEAEKRGISLSKILAERGLPTCSFEESVARKKTLGSPGRKALKQQLKRARALLKKP